MIDLTSAQRRLTLIAPAAVAGLLLSACGSGSGYGSRPAVSSSSAGGAAEQIATAKGEYGTYLTGDDGKAVYLWLGDSGSTSNCSSACASAWPPVLTTGAPTAGAGAVAADLGTTKRSDGSTQVTYKGHPLYYFAGDSASGQTNGQGTNGFGAKWWLVSPAGVGITSSDSSGGSSSSSGGGGYGY